MAEKNLEDNTFDLTTWEEVQDMAAGPRRLRPHQVVRQPGVRAGHEGKGRRVQPAACLSSSRGTEGKCPVCGKECTTDIYWGVAY